MEPGCGMWLCAGSWQQGEDIPPALSCMLQPPRPTLPAAESAHHSRPVWHGHAAGACLGAAHSRITRCSPGGESSSRACTLLGEPNLWQRTPAPGCSLPGFSRLLASRSTWVEPIGPAALDLPPRLVIHENAAPCLPVRSCHCCLSDQRCPALRDVRRRPTADCLAVAW